MKINSLKLTEKDTTQFDKFFETNLIHSKINSKGKTTYLRLLFFSLGYQVPQTSKIDFQKIKSKIDFNTNKGHFFAERHGNELILTKDDSKIGSYLLPSEHIKFLKEIFDCDNEYLLRNLLGVMYVDQEKGWTLINRGCVVGRIKLNIEELIAGLDDVNIDNELNKRNQIEKEIKKYNALIDIKDYQNELAEIEIDDELKSGINTRNNKISINEFKIQKIRSELKDIDVGLKNERSIIESILSLGIEFNDGKVCRKINRNDIKNLVDYEQELKVRSKLLRGQIIQLENENNFLKQEKINLLGKDINIFADEDLNQKELKIIEQNLKEFKLDQFSLNDLLEKYKQEKKSIQKIIENKLKNSKQEYAKKIIKTMLELASKDNLNISEIKNDSNFVFTSDLKSYSGAILQKIAVCFKIALLKAVEDKIGEDLILVLDSPRTRELDENNAKRIFSVILKYIGNSQLFVGSIYEYEGIKFAREIKNKAIEEDTYHQINIFDDKD